MENCNFCKIVKHELDAAKIYENADNLIFLDRRPIFKGHCLLIPKQHFETLTDLPYQLITSFFTTLQQLAKVVEVAMDAQGSFVAINNKVSQSVPHLHFHVVPRNKQDGLKGFFWPRHPYKEDELIQTQKKLITTWKRLESI